MAGKSGKYRLLILVIAAFAVAGCSPPVGSIGPRVPRSVYDGLRIEYQRTYKKDESFLLSELRVYTISRDQGRQPVLLSQSAYQVYIEHPVGVTAVPVVTSFKFTVEGRGYIIVKYQEYSIQCPIEVTPDSGNGQDSGIIIIWDEPK